MIKELLDKRELLIQIAIELYGEFWITDERFWDSPTEIEMRNVQYQLDDLGYTEEPTEEEKILSQIIFDEMVRRGKFQDEDEEEDDEEDINL
jgi:hypothetical protein